MFIYWYLEKEMKHLQICILTLKIKNLQRLEIEFILAINKFTTKLASYDTQKACYLKLLKFWLQHSKWKMRCQVVEHFCLVSSKW